MHKGTNVDVAPLPLMSSKLHLPAIDTPRMPARRAEADSVEAEAQGLLSSALNKKLLVETCYSSTIFVHSRAGSSLEAHYRMTSLLLNLPYHKHTYKQWFSVVAISTNPLRQSLPRHILCDVYDALLLT